MQIRLFDYQDKETFIILNDFEDIVYFNFSILSGDGVLKVYYKDHVDFYDSSKNRLYDFFDGSWDIRPEDIDVLNRMNSHYDTDELNQFDCF